MHDGTEHAQKRAVQSKTATLAAIKHPLWCGPDCDVSPEYDQAGNLRHLLGYHVGAQRTVEITDSTVTLQQIAAADIHESPDPWGRASVRILIDDHALGDSTECYAEEEGELEQLAAACHAAAGWLPEPTPDDVVNGIMAKFIQLPESDQALICAVLNGWSSGQVTTSAINELLVAGDLDGISRLLRSRELLAD